MSLKQPIIYKIISTFKRNFVHDELIPEVLECYFDTLKSKPVNITWTRDGDYIVADIEVNGNKFMTQAESAEEFMEMLSDAVMVGYDIPENYQSKLNEMGKFILQKKDFDKLNNRAVKRSGFSITTSAVGNRVMVKA